MNLHLDREAFTELVTAASHELLIPSGIIEKDYYVTTCIAGIICPYQWNGI